jgi:hypothetical protein
MNELTQCSYFSCLDKLTVFGMLEIIKKKEHKKTASRPVRSFETASSFDKKSVSNLLRRVKSQTEEVFFMTCPTVSHHNQSNHSIYLSIATRYSNRRPPA